jgi:hypothetical protein
MSLLWGSEGSNPAPSTGESTANSSAVFHPEPDDPAARCAAEGRPPALEMSVPTGSAQDGPHERRDTRRRQPAR